MKFVIGIKSNMGYSPNQVRGIKVKDLKEMLEDLEDDDEVITCDYNNKYGANFGMIMKEMLDEDDYEDDDEEDEEW